MNSDEVLLYPLMGEKSTIIREKENKLTFIVSKNSTKKDVKSAIEILYSAKVVKVNILCDIEGKKKAIIKLTEDHSAEDIASKFGVL